MSKHQVLEGTWEEISLRSEELSGHRVKVILLPEDLHEESKPSQRMLSTLREIAKRHEARKETSDEGSQQLLREARAGGMYGFEPADELTFDQGMTNQAANHAPSVNVHLF